MSTSEANKYELKRYCDLAPFLARAKEKRLTQHETKLLECKFPRGYSDAQMQTTFYFLGSRTSIWRAVKAAKEKYQKQNETN